MTLSAIILIAVGLSMDAFAVSVCKGLAGPVYKPRYSVICGIWFGVFQAIMPAAGYLLAAGLANRISAFDHWIAFALLAVIGFNMIRAALKSGEAAPDSSFAPKAMAVLAFATAVDALAVGITFAFLSVNIFSAAAIIGICTFLLSAAGVKIGSVFGKRFRSKAEIAGGIILIILAARILLEHMTGNG
ncbi:MAG: manganese efflux pump MntP family protein [Ruminococcus sp.]|nr:manganese efflux pump MntP family protein [Ruminococcus sp.]